jgi:hypothetical protein
MADSVPQVDDNHDKAHEVMSEQDAIQRGKDLAEQNNAIERNREEEDRDRGHTPKEGNVPENNKDNNKNTGNTEPGDLQETRNTKKSSSKRK